MLRPILPLDPLQLPDGNFVRARRGLLRLGGEVGFQARKVLSRLDTLRKEFPGVRFVEWDERFTTRLAGSRGIKKGTVRVDHLAAARMLQEYLGAREGL